MEDIVSGSGYQKNWADIGGKLLEIAGKGSAILTVVQTLTELLSHLILAPHRIHPMGVLNFVIACLIFYLVAINSTIAKVYGALSGGALVWSTVSAVKN